MASCIDLVVHCVRTPAGRYVQEVLGVGTRVEADTIETTRLFSHDGGRLRPNPAAVFEHPLLDDRARELLHEGS